MANHVGMVLTKKGRTLQAKAQTGVQLEFTKVVVGDGLLAANADITTLTQLIAAKMMLGIQEIAVIGDGTSRIRVVMQNTNLATGFFIREIGVYAKDPDEGEILYSICNSGDQSEWLPPIGGPRVVEIVLDLITVVGNAENIVTVIDDSLVFVSQKEFKNHQHKVADITDFPTSMPANGGNADTVDGKHANDFVAIEAFDKMQAENKSYIDTKDFLNFKPKIGYFDDDCYANIYGSFNFSVCAYNAVYPIHDNMEREVVYFSGYNGMDSIPQVYLAYRMNDNQGFSFLSKPLRPHHLDANEVMDKVIGLGSEWIFYVTRNTVTDTYQTWFAKTGGSSNADDWNAFENVTLIISPSNWDNLVPLYVSEHDVIVLVSTGIEDGVSIKMAVYKSDLTVLKTPNTLINLVTDNLLDCSEFLSIDELRSRGRLAVYYNKADNQLNILQPIGRYAQYTSASEKKFWDRTVYLPYKLPAGFLKTGTGTPQLQLTPKVDYNWLNMGKGLFLNEWGEKYLTISQDDFNNVLYFTSSDQSVISTLYFYRLDNTTLSPVDIRKFLKTPQVYLNFKTPDACPWAKEILYPMYFMNGMFYGRGSSQTYGEASYATEVENTIKDSNLKFKIGTWWLTSKEEEDTTRYFSKNLCFQRVSASQTKYFYHDNQESFVGEIKKEEFVGTDGRNYSGRRSVVWTDFKIPKVPATYSYIACFPDMSRRIVYYIVSDITANDPLRQGYAFLLVYHDHSKSFTEHRSVPTNWDSLCQYSYSSLGIAEARISVYSTTFIDEDGVLFFSLAGRTPSGSSSTGIFKVDLATTPVIAACKLSQGSYRTQSIGYDVRTGYFATVYNGNQNGVIKTSKSLSTGETKTREQFFNGEAEDCFTYNLTRDSKIGLIAYIQQTHVFLGGYFSIVPSQEVYLKPYCDNYIYFSRDSADRNKVNVEVQLRKIGSEMGFSRVLVSKITTDHEKIIAQENYPVKWNY